MDKSTLTILNPDKLGWFLGTDNEQQQYKPVCYHYVICHSLLNYLVGQDYDYDKGKEALGTLLEKLGSQKTGQPPEHLRLEEFMELLPLTINKKDWGYVIVDQADGMYPLVCYSDERAKEIEQDTETKVNYKNRASAFKAALRNVLDKYDEVYKCLKGRTPNEWNKEFQESLCSDTNGFGFLNASLEVGVAQEAEYPW